MCGRTAQSRRAVRMAAQMLGAPMPREEEHNENGGSDAGGGGQEQSNGWTDNFNLSPGMEAMVFWKDQSGNIRSSLRTWGLVTKNGTRNNPLAAGMAQHFENLMYNARSDTLCEKITFSNLLQKRRTCLVAVDGFFEWKAELKGRKQPYYVRSQTDFLLLAGLWTSVKTGREQDERLETFAILTTEACPSLTWLHHRMPVCVWDNELAMQWLSQEPGPLVRKLEEGAANKHKDKSGLDWHPVTPDMTSLKYRSEKSIVPIKRSSVKSFFSAANKKNKTNTEEASQQTGKIPPTKTTASLSPTKHGTKRPSVTRSPQQGNKKAKKVPLPAKKGAITSFFAPKS